MMTLSKKGLWVGFSQADISGKKCDKSLPFLPWCCRFPADFCTKPEFGHGYSFVQTSLFQIALITLDMIFLPIFKGKSAQ